MLGGARVLKKVNLNKILIYLFLFFVTWCFCNVKIFDNNFIFIIPWIIFCFLNNRVYGFVVFIISLIIFFDKSLLFIFMMLGFLSLFLFFRYFYKISNNKLGDFVSFFSFFIVFISGVISFLILEKGNLIYSFFSGVCSYWIMRNFFTLLNVFKEKDEINYKSTTFLLFILGVVFIGVDISFFVFDLNLILVVWLAFLAGSVGEEEGVLYSFLISAVYILMYGVDYNLLLFVIVSMLSSLLNTVSKGVLFITYISIVLAFLYYFDINYLDGVNYFVGAFLYLLIPFDNKLFVGKRKYIKILEEKNRVFRLEVANKLDKMDSLFNLICSKLDIKGRLKKNDRLLLCEEVVVFSDILNEFSCEIRNNYGVSKKNRIERELYKYGFDVIDVLVKEDVLNNNFIKLSIRCKKEEINKTILPCLSKVINMSLEICDLKYNDIFDFYDISIICKNKVDFKFGVEQRARNGLVCGDSYLIYENERYKLFIVSDGMGYGEEAKDRSKKAIDLLKKYLDVGFEVEKSISSLNSILKNKYNKEGYTTFDMLVFDKYHNKFYFNKHGACDSYILRNNDICVIEGNDLPLGIVDKVGNSFMEVEIKNDDCVIIMSDGVDENNLRKFKNKDPQKIAREIIFNQKDIIDDASVLVINIKKREY